MRKLFVLCGAALVVTACNAAPETAVAQAPAATPAVGPVKPPTTDAEKIANAMAAAPEAISKDADIIEFDATMQRRTLRAGTNGWTCLPDYAPSPGVDPMCLDRNALAWVEAWATKKDPPKDKLGFGYMLLGGSDASNTDPFASGPADGHGWVETGPHVMIFNIGDKFDGYPVTHDNTKVPYVMFANTPYAHLMLPIK